MTRTEEITSEIIQSNLLLAIGRVSMALFLPMMGLFGWLLTSYLDGRFNLEHAATDALANRTLASEEVAKAARDRADGVLTRITILETNQALGRDDRLQFQRDISERFSRLADEVSGLGREMSLMSGKVDQLLSQKRADGGP